MKVTTISCEAKLSKAINEGTWKTVGLGAEATVNAREDWQEAQQALYGDTDYPTQGTLH